MLRDLNLLVISGASERSEAKSRALLKIAGFKLRKIFPTMLPLSVIEAVRK
jgi:hypothetical protein